MTTPEEAKKLILEALENVEKVAKEYEFRNIQSIVCSLMGSIHGGMDGMLADMVRDFTKNTLIPELKNREQQSKITLN